MANLLNTSQNLHFFLFRLFFIYPKSDIHLYQEQEVALRSMPDIVVATPGRMIDHLRNSMSVTLEDLAVLILDEADRLLELGFSADIHELVPSGPFWFNHVTLE